MRGKRKLLFGKTLLIAFVATILVTSLLVYFTGITSHRSILDNALISLSILAGCLFLFLTAGLYNGLNVLDNYSHKLQLRWKGAKNRLTDFSGLGGESIADVPTVGDDLAGIVGSIFFWIIVTFVLVVLIIFLQALVWFMFVLLAMAIYWIIIRALKLIFSKSAVCENNLPKSVAYALGYTILYVGWMFGIAYLSVLF